LSLNYGVSDDITGNDVQTPLRTAASNVHLEEPRELLRNGCIVHIARKRDLTAQPAAADSDRVEDFRESLKQRACVTIAIEKYSQFLKAAGEKRNVEVELSCRKPELLWKYPKGLLSAFHNISRKRTYGGTVPVAK